MSTNQQNQTPPQGGEPAPAEDAVTLSSFDIKAAAEEIYGGKAPAPAAAPKPGEGATPAQSKASDPKPGEPGEHDDGELEPWDDETPAAKGKTESDDDEDDEADDGDPLKGGDLPADEADERETWRKTRLNKVKESRDFQKTRAEQEKARADRLEAELAELRQGRAPAQDPSAPTTPAPVAPQIQTQQGREQFFRHLVQTDPEINALALAVQQVEQGVQAGAFPDMATYTAALTRANTALEIAFQGRISAEQNRAQSQQQQAQAAQATQMRTLRTNYDARVKASTIPHMAKLAERIDRVAGQLHSDLHMAILDRPNPEVAAAALASNQDEFRWFAEQSRKHQGGRLPASVLARLGETVARFETRTSPAAKQERQRKVDESLPRTPRSNGGGSQTYEDMDPWEYAQRVQRGQAKDIVRNY